MADSVDLYVAASRQVAEARFAGVLDDGERARAARLRDIDARRDFLVAHGLCRLALSRARPHIAPTDWAFALGPHGKPRPVPEEGLCVSLSHAAGLVAVAVSESAEIGVDVEAMSAGLARQETARLVCSDAERAQLAGCDPAAWHSAFFLLWTIKEAVLKASGAGLSRDPRGISCRIDPPGLVEVPADLGPVLGWTGEVDGHRLSLMAMTGDRPILRVVRVADVFGPSDALEPFARGVFAAIG